MTDLFENQTIGFKRSATYGDDLIAAADTEHWRWGKHNALWGDYPLDKRELRALVTGAARTPQKNYFAKYFVGGIINATAINAIPLYYALGKVTNSGAGDPYTHVIENAEIGSDLPDFVQRSEDASTEANIYESYLGNYIKNLTMSVDWSDKTQMMAYGINTWGQQTAAPQFGGAASNLIAPGGNDNHFLYDNNSVVNWNGNFTDGVYSSGGTDITDDVRIFALTIDNNLVDDTPQGQYYPDNFIFGGQMMIASFDILRNSANAKTVYTDFRTMANNETTRNMHFKIYQSATHYIQVDMSDFTLGAVERNNTAGTTEEPVFRCSGQFKTIKVTAVDPLAGATYYV
jgi:hypothetical protein